jgi:hypothetical protein
MEGLRLALDRRGIIADGRLVFGLTAAEPIHLGNDVFCWGMILSGQVVLLGTTSDSRLCVLCCEHPSTLADLEGMNMAVTTDVQSWDIGSIADRFLEDRTARVRATLAG